ncbi:MAG TPA: apolipoprotein N-acyltransferase [Kribbellaceae bacterium]|nr:apolipoprotein N-acyltransferase [Kribbellaceae bacterium]
MARLSSGPRRALRLVLAIGAGAALGLAYEPYDLPWIAPLSVAALLVALRGTSMRAGFLVGSGFGIAWYAVLVPWLTVIGGDAAIALAVLEGLFYGVFGMLAGQALRIRGWLLWVPALWVATEFATASVPFGGFPWGRLAWAFAGSDFGLYAAWVGVAGVSFLVALLGALLYSLVPAPRGPSRVPPRLAALVAAAVLVGAAFALPAPGTSDERTVTVATVQGNVPGDGMDALGEARTVTRNHLAATEQLARDVASGSKARPELVIWPENSTDIDPFRDAETRADIEAAVKAVGVPILVGAVLQGPGPNERQTTGVVWDPVSGPGQVYAKRHPVPFGEYIPFREQLLPYIKRLELVGRQTAPGTVPGVLRIGDVLYGDVICFEIAYDDVMDDVMDGGAQILVVQTNNATYGGTAQPDQQFAITRLRAVETGRDVLVASTNGISGVIHPDGAVEHKSGQGVADVYVTEVPVRTSKTLATVLGPWPQWILTGLGLLGAVLALVHRRRRRLDEPAEVARGRRLPDSRDLQVAGAGAEKRRESDT